MLMTIATVLIIIWFLGMFFGYALGGFIHILLVAAIIIILVRLINGGEQKTLSHAPKEINRILSIIIICLGVLLAIICSFFGYSNELGHFGLAMIIGVPVISVGLVFLYSIVGGIISALGVISMFLIGMTEVFNGQYQIGVGIFVIGLIYSVVEIIFRSNNKTG